MRFSLNFSLGLFFSFLDACLRVTLLLHYDTRCPITHTHTHPKNVFLLNFMVVSSKSRLDPNRTHTFRRKKKRDQVDKTKNEREREKERERDKESEWWSERIEKDEKTVNTTAKINSGCFFLSLHVVGLSNKINKTDSTTNAENFSTEFVHDWFN